MIKLSFNQKIIVGILFLTLMLILWYVFIFQPQRMFISTTLKEIEKKQRELTLVNTSLQNLESIRGTIDAIDDERDSLLLSVPNKESISEISNRIILIIKENNLTIENIQPSLDQLIRSKDNIVKVPFEIILRGEYLQFGKFMEALHQLPFKVFINKIQINNDQDFSALQIIIDSYIFVLNQKSKV